MLKKLLKDSGFFYSGNRFASIHLANNTVHVLLLEMSAQGSWQVTDFQHIVHRPGQWQTALHQALALLPANTRLSVVLSSSQYQLLQADKPMVPGPEIIQALPWQIKELISTDISDIVVDYIDLPVKPQQTERINIVVASKSWLKELIEIIHQYKVRLHIIQPEEWLPMTLLPSEAQPSMLVMHQPEQELLIQIIYKGTLYFSCRVRGFNQLYSSDMLQQSVFDNFLLELQRSMDYFESQLKQPPVKDIILSVSQTEFPLFAELFRQNAFSQIFPLQLKAEYQWLPQEHLDEHWPVLAGMVSLLKQAAAI